MEAYYGYFFGGGEGGQEAGNRNLCSTCKQVIVQTYTVGGFNVSNLMGITRRMIDIGKKMTFYFLQNV